MSNGDRLHGDRLHGDRLHGDRLHDERNQQARDAALQAAAAVDIQPSSLVAFRSSGRVLVIGEAQRSKAAAEELLQHEGLSCCVLATSGSIESSRELPVVYSNSRPLSIQGHLGQFSVNLQTADGLLNLATAMDERLSHFDLILDLHPQALLRQEIPPLGYYAPGDNNDRLQATLTTLAEMVGEFEKAKFFTYNAEICAHGNSQLTGCTRCLDVCPTEAITSLIDRVEIDPYACQGGGSCATACPSGAIVYTYPRPGDMSNRLRILLKRYSEAGGTQAILLFHDGELGSQTLARIELPAHIIAVEVEEIGSVGIDLWLSALAFGATRILLLDTPEVAPSIRRELDVQIGIARQLLHHMGYPPTAISRWHCAENDGALPDQALMPPIRAAGFAGTDEKRNAIFFALDWLYRQAPDPQPVAELPSAAPFGLIEVDQNLCTLCMACVSVCPAAALNDGGDRPRLSFIEANCVQCGLCEIACPEHAITRVPRYVYDREQRQQTRVLNEEQPFHCITCGTAFATQSIIGKMQTKLAGHSMFQNETALRRLKMCGDCRVKDMFAKDYGLDQ